MEPRQSTIKSNGSKFQRVKKSDKNHVKWQTNFQKTPA